MQELTLEQLREIAISRQIPDWGKLSEAQLIVALASQERDRMVDRFAEAFERVCPQRAEAIAVDEFYKVMRQKLNR